MLFKIFLTHLFPYFTAYCFRTNTRIFQALTITIPFYHRLLCLSSRDLNFEKEENQVIEVAQYGMDREHFLGLWF